MSKKTNIIVNKVDLGVEEVERHRLIAESKEESIKYLTNQNIKLQHKISSNKLLGFNILCIPYDKCLSIAKKSSSKSNHVFTRHIDEYINSYIVYVDNSLYVGENGFDMKPDDYLLINTDDDTFIISNEAHLKRDTFRLLRLNENDL